MILRLFTSLAKLHYYLTHFYFFLNISQLSKCFLRLVHLCLFNNRQVFKIYRISFNSLKLADVVPIFKKNMLNKMNYRPIRILSCISKIFETLLISPLRMYFNDIFSQYLSVIELVMDAKMFRNILSIYTCM